MEYCPHDYLKSSLKEDIEIRFYKQHGYNYLVLEYRMPVEGSEKKAYFRSTRVITHPSVIYEELRAAELKLVEMVKKAKGE